MMTVHTISVPLPDRAALSPEAEDDLRNEFELIVGMRYEGESDWRAVRARLLAAGWNVECTIQWHVVARRDGKIESAFGSSRGEAFERLDRVTRVESLEGTP
jgi:hypothetical protein